jgi:hypothetical protein
MKGNSLGIIRAARPAGIDHGATVGVEQRWFLLSAFGHARRISKEVEVTEGTEFQNEETEETETNEEESLFGERRRYLIGRSLLAPDVTARDYVGVENPFHAIFQDRHIEID